MWPRTWVKLGSGLWHSKPITIVITTLRDNRILGIEPFVIYSWMLVGRVCYCTDFPIDLTGGGLTGFDILIAMWSVCLHSTWPVAEESPRNALQHAGQFVPAAKRTLRLLQKQAPQVNGMEPVSGDS